MDSKITPDFGPGLQMLNWAQIKHTDDGPRMGLSDSRNPRSPLPRSCLRKGAQPCLENDTPGMHISYDVLGERQGREGFGLRRSRHLR